MCTIFICDGSLRLPTL
uniref:Uncharacterized protein n=1 Tax=Anguilla anguilla TaxID=7936 RepID=A0A0E9VNT3_ANGAN